MKTTFKIIAIFAIFSVIAISQACCPCSEDIIFCEIDSFKTTYSWNANDTIKHSELKFYLEARTSNCSIPCDCGLNNPLLITKGEIDSISIFSNNDYDSIYLINSNLDEIFFVSLRYETPYIEDTLALLSYPVETHKYLEFFITNNHPPDSTRQHQFTVIYREVDSTLLKITLPPVYIKP